MVKNSNDYTRKMLNTIRTIQENSIKKNIKFFLTEDVENDGGKKGAIAITNNQKFGNEVLKTQIEAFKNQVDSSATFSEENTNEPTKNALVYIKGGNLIFSGKIPSKRDFIFQFNLKDDEDGNGLFIWCDGMSLTDSNLTMLRKLHGFYLNWRDQWQKDSQTLEMYEKML